MMDRDRSKVVLAAAGMAALSLELLAVLGAAPHASSVMRSVRAHAVLKASGVVARAVSAAVQEQATRVAGEALLGAVQGATRVYGAMLRVTPHGCPREIRVVEYRAARRGQGARRCVIETVRVCPDEGAKTSCTATSSGEAI